MVNPPANVDLMESALSAVEGLLSGLGPPPSSTTSRSDEAACSAAQASLRICLNAAAALLDVSRSLLRPAEGRAAEDLELEWKTLIVLTKEASRSAYRGALVMAEQRNLLTAQTQRFDPNPSIALGADTRWR
jgi:hypothetical protein